MFVNRGHVGHDALRFRTGNGQHVVNFEEFGDTSFTEKFNETTALVIRIHLA